MLRLLSASLAVGVVAHSGDNPVPAAPAAESGKLLQSEAEHGAVTATAAAAQTAQSSEVTRLIHGVKTEVHHEVATAAQVLTWPTTGCTM